MNRDQNQTNSNDLDSLLKEFQDLTASSAASDVNNQEINRNVGAVNQQNLQERTSVPTESRVSNDNPTVGNVSGTSVTHPVQQPVVQPRPVVQPTAPVQQSVPASQPVQSAASEVRPAPIPVTPVVAPQPVAAAPVQQPAPMPQPAVSAVQSVQQPVATPAQLQETPEPEVISGGENGNVGNTGDNGKKGKRGKKGKSGNNNLLIIIIFVLVGAFIFCIPMINNYLKDNKTKASAPTATPSATPTADSGEDNEEDENKELVLTCNLPEQSIAENQVVRETYKYYYVDNKITKFETIYRRIYDENTDITSADYISKQNVCGSLSTNYANIVGYTATCGEKDKTFTITNTYDLIKFTNPTKVKIGTEEVTLQSSVNYEDDINTVRTAREQAGATCK